MTQLFPKSDKVDISLNDESVTVPDGKVWVVSIMSEFDMVMINDPDGGQAGRLDPTENEYDSTISKMTLNEDWEVEARGRCVVAGWEFNYE